MPNFSWWLAQIWQAFKWTPNDTHAHSGMDLGMPCGSVLTSPVAGTVVSSGMEPWGGQVNVLVPPGRMPPGYDQNSPYILSFLHMSRIDTAGGQVNEGQQIGLSGQPPPGYGSGCHLHFEVTHGNIPPYMGYSPWTPTATSYPQNPAPFLANLGNFAAGGATVGAVAGGQPGGQVGNTGGQLGNLVGGQQGVQTVGLVDAATLSTALTTAAGASPACGPGFQQVSIGPFNPCVPITVYRWFTQPIRILKIVSATIIMIIVGMLLIVPAIGPTAAEVAGVATGQPELVAVGANIKKYQKEKKAQKAAARGKPTAPVGGGINTDQLAYQRAQSNQASNNARRAAATRNFATEEAARASQRQAGRAPREQRRHAGTTSEKEAYSEKYQQRPSGLVVPKTAQASKAPPTPSAIAVPPPMPPAERGKKTGLTFPENILFWRRQGRRGVPTLVRQGKQQPGPLKPPPVESEPKIKSGEVQHYQQASLSDAIRDLGITGKPLPSSPKIAGTEVSLSGEEHNLKALQGLLKNESDLKERAALERAIAETKARIKKMREQGK